MEVKVCVGSACHLKGSYDVIKEFQKIISEYKMENRITLKGAFCMNNCTKAVSTQISDETISMSPDNVRDYLEKAIEENKWSI